MTFLKKKPLDQAWKDDPWEEEFQICTKEIDPSWEWTIGGLKNRQVGEKWVSDDCSYLCKGLKFYNHKYSHSKAMAVFYKIVKLVKNGVLMIIHIYAKVST
jgi:hypothetical protein